MRERVYGIETEYAILYEPGEAPPRGGPPRARVLFELIETALKTSYRALPARYRNKRGLFLENGALVTFETIDGFSGLLELSTPECRTARDVTIYQSAMDHLAATVAQSVTARLREGEYGGSIRLAKNCGDGKGHTYGTHENYYVEDPSPPLTRRMKAAELGCRAVWKASAAVVTLLSWALVAAALLVLLGAGLAGLAALAVVALASALAGIVLRPFPTGQWVGKLVPETASRLERGWRGLVVLLEQATAWTAQHLLLRVAHPALVLYDAFLTRAVVRPFVQELSSYLVTRAIWCGSGRLWLERPRRGSREAWPSVSFSISQRSALMRRLAGVGLHVDSLFDLKAFISDPASLGRRRKRLEIVCGDSNMSELCIFMKMGVTGLLLRMVEEGERFEDLRLADPISTLHGVSSDESLQMRYPMADGRKLTALAIQREFLRRATVFYADTGATETGTLLAMWARTLDGLEHDRWSLAPQVDWITKRVLMRQMAGTALEDVDEVARVAADVVAAVGDASVPRIRSLLKKRLPRRRFLEVRRVVEFRELSWERLVELSLLAYQMRRLDLRFHESDGGHKMLLAAGAVRSVSTEDERTHALREAPMGTRAVIRGELVRTFASESGVSISWDRFRGPRRTDDRSFVDPLLESPAD